MRAKAILLCTGVSYRFLDAKDLARFTGCGVSYGSPSLSEKFEGKTIVVVGGANSAGQAAVHLSDCPQCTVKLVIRSTIDKSMSKYLIDKLKPRLNVEIMEHTEIMEAKGGMRLESVIIKRGEGVEEISLDKMFILIGAVPKTRWLRGILDLDDHGFIVTGHKEGLSSMEAIPGVFAAGDVRSKSVKRVASAVGEGARAVNDIHGYIAKLRGLA